MSDTGDSVTSNTCESQPVSDTGESSVFSDWSVVDEHGDLPDDDTTSTASSVEVVEEDDPDESQSTPIAGSPGSVAPRFILRLPSHEQASDTDEDPVEDNSSGSSSARCDNAESVSASKRGIPGKQVSKQGELENMRKTLDTLKQKMQPSYAEDSSLSSAEMFGDGRSDKKAGKTGDDMQPQRTVESIGNHGSVLSGDLSLESSVSSNYSFLSRDAGTECSLLRDRSESLDRVNDVEDKPEKHEDYQSEPVINNYPQGTSKTDSQNEKEAGQPGTMTTESQSAAAVQGTTLRAFLSLLMEYPVKYMFLAGLASYTGVLILAVLYIHGPGPGPAFKGEDVMMNKCLQNTQDLKTKLEIYKNAYYDKDTIDRKKVKELELSLAEKEDIANKLKDKERDILELQKQLNALHDEMKAGRTTEAECQEIKEKQIDLQIENEELLKALDESSLKCTQNIEDCKSHGDSVLQMCVKAKEDEKRQVEKDLDGVRMQCQADLDKIKTQCQVDVDKVKGQCQMDQDKIRNQCRSDLDSLRIQAEEGNKYSKGQCDKSMKPTQNGEFSKFEDEQNGKNAQPGDAKETEDAKTVGETDTPGSRSKDDKEQVDTQSETRKNTGKDEKQSKSRDRSEKSSDRSKRNNRKPGDDQTRFNKGDHSNGKSGKGDDSTFNWADIVMELMNKTRGQIQDTWAKVKNMSESLQDSFCRKVEHLSKKFHGKLARKMNKWFRKFQKHAHQDNAHKANTKRRQYTTDNDATSSNRTVEQRLVKLSHQVEALNARKFKKWREFPKVLDIQSEFEQVNILVKTGQSQKDQQQMKMNKLSDEYTSWFDCQFRWWKDLDVVTVTDDCYLSLCCWQVKVTGGDVKQCRKTKRQKGIVEDTCSLDLIPEPQTPGSDKNGDSQYTRTKRDSADRFQREDKVHRTQSTYNARSRKDDTTNQEPPNDDEENWFLGRGEERAYQREEPDDWFFRRKNKRAPEHKKSKYSIRDGDFDEDDETDECHYDLDTGDCIFE